MALSKVPIALNITTAAWIIIALLAWNGAINDPAAYNSPVFSSEHLEGYPLDTDAAFAPGWDRGAAAASSSIPFPSHTLVTLIDGLRLDQLNAMKQFSESPIIDEGFTVTARVVERTHSLPGYATVLMGTDPYYSGLVANTATDEIQTELQTLFALYNTTGNYGSSWVQALGGDDVDFTAVVDNDVAEALLPISTWVNDVEEAGSPLDFTYVYESEIDSVGHTHGPLSRAAREMVETYDEGLSNAFDAVTTAAWADDILVALTADHGHANAGGHGGGKYETVNVPFLLWTSGGSGLIKSSPDSDPPHPVYLRDVAPTVAALSNKPRPAHATGRVVFEALADEGANPFWETIARIEVNASLALVSEIGISDELFQELSGEVQAMSSLSGLEYVQSASRFHVEDFHSALSQHWDEQIRGRLWAGIILALLAWGTASLIAYGQPRSMLVVGFTLAGSIVLWIILAVLSRFEIPGYTEAGRTFIAVSLVGAGLTAPTTYLAWSLKVLDKFSWEHSKPFVLAIVIDMALILLVQFPGLRSNVPVLAGPLLINFAIWGGVLYKTPKSFDVYDSDQLGYGVAIVGLFVSGFTFLCQIPIGLWEPLFIGVERIMEVYIALWMGSVVYLFLAMAYIYHLFEAWRNGFEDMSTGQKLPE